MRPHVFNESWSALPLVMIDGIYLVWLAGGRLLNRFGFRCTERLFSISLDLAVRPTGDLDNEADDVLLLFVRPQRNIMPE